ncbi:sulfite exporter TauE/SafE family protein [Fulvimarina endophytica]|uniref:Probable membrane transporter protein n=1 Tax=Fulvimarina endophytica TaxID=2293836 RepID=A0A371X5A8_9HYPH|nr:sulfite exporter TauE/SafE family protein [Fulvimarina endophytica]RFC64405.1 sulfite exporter TauE/SafE family protein [Fulvimarina endophytica]
MDGHSILSLGGLLLVLLVTGAFTGVIAGLLGVGGGIVVVPVLVIVVGLFALPEDIDMLMIVGTSLATIVPTSIASSRAHHRKGSVDVALLKGWLPAIVCGALIGGFASKIFGANGLALIFGVVGLLVAANLLKRKTIVLRTSPPESILARSAIGFPIGFLSSLMGIGGGTLSVPTLTMLSVPVHRAVGTAAVFGLGIAIPALIGFVWSGLGVPGRPVGSLGFVNLPTAIAIASVSIFTAPIGARLAHRLEPRVLKIAFAVFLSISSVNLLLDVFS